MTTAWSSPAPRSPATDNGPTTPQITMPVEPALPSSDGSEQAMNIGDLANELGNTHATIIDLRADTAAVASEAERSQAHLHDYARGSGNPLMHKAERTYDEAVDKMHEARLLLDRAATALSRYALDVEIDLSVPPSTSPVPAAAADNDPARHDNEAER